jgi:hypothetical protein
MRSVIPFLRSDERETLRWIMSQESGSLTVRDVFPVFTRESESHKSLRRLRAAQFIRPAESGRWNPDERIEVKPFARLMWDRVGEDVIFAGVPGAAAPAAAAATEPADDVVDLGLGEDDKEVKVPAAEPVAEPAAEPAAEEVVDLRDVEEEKQTAEPAEPAVMNKSAGFEDDAVLDPGDYDDLYQYAEEELRGKS